MKLTKSRLKRLIKEEIENLTELERLKKLQARDKRKKMEARVIRLKNRALMSAADAQNTPQMDFYASQDADASRDIEKEFAEAYGEEALKALQASPEYKKRPALMQEAARTRKIAPPMKEELQEGISVADHEEALDKLKQYIKTKYSRDEELLDLLEDAIEKTKAFGYEMVDTYAFVDTY